MKIRDLRRNKCIIDSYLVDKPTETYKDGIIIYVPTGYSIYLEQTECRHIASLLKAMEAK